MRSWPRFSNFSWTNRVDSTIYGRSSHSNELCKTLCQSWTVDCWQNQPTQQFSTVHQVEDIMFRTRMSKFGTRAPMHITRFDPMGRRWHQEIHIPNVSRIPSISHEKAHLLIDYPRAQMYTSSICTLYAVTPLYWSNNDTRAYTLGTCTLLRNHWLVECFLHTITSLIRSMQ